MNKKNENWFLMGKRNLYLFPLFCILKSYTHTIKKSLGASYSAAVAVFREGKRTPIYFPLKDRQLLEESAFKKIETNPLFIKKVKSNTYQSIRKLLNFTARVSRLNLDKFTNKELSQLFIEFNKKYSDSLTYGVVTVFADPPLIEKLTKYLDEKISIKKNKKKKLINYLNILINPPTGTFLGEEKKDLLYIASLIWKNKKIRKLFRRDIKEIKKNLPTLDPLINKKINNHVKKYAHLLIDYECPPKTINDFLRMLKDILKKEENPTLLLKKIKLNEKQLIEKRRKIIQELGIDQAHQRLFKIMEELIIIKNYRKFSALTSLSQIQKLISEIARRLEINPIDVKFFLPLEIKNFLEKNKKINKSELLKRKELSVLIITPQQEKILIGKKGEDFWRRMNIVKEEQEVIGQIHGISAFPGKIKGIVKIINETGELKKMNPNEVLVSEVTNQGFVLAFKIAKAVITDEGGLTSHAAVLAREFKIPCIVGTKIATKVLKDGDLVEVDANKGVVRILKK